MYQRWHHQRPRPNDQAKITKMLATTIFFVTGLVFPFTAFSEESVTYAGPDCQFQGRPGHAGPWNTGILVIGPRTRDTSIYCYIPTHFPGPLRPENIDRAQVKLRSSAISAPAISARLCIVADAGGITSCGATETSPIGPVNGLRLYIVSPPSVHPRPIVLDHAYVLVTIGPGGPVYLVDYLVQWEDE